MNFLNTKIAFYLLSILGAVSIYGFAYIFFKKAPEIKERKQVIKQAKTLVECQQQAKKYRDFKACEELIK